MMLLQHIKYPIIDAITQSATTIDTSDDDDDRRIDEVNTDEIY